MGTTIHFKIKYHGLKFSDKYLDYFKKISHGNGLGDDTKRILPPYTEFTSKDFPSLQRVLDNDDEVWLSSLNVLYYKDLGDNQQDLNIKTFPIKAQISTKSFEDAEKNTSYVLDKGGHYSTPDTAVQVYLAPSTDKHNIVLSEYTDVYIILIIDSDPQSDSWYQPSILYCDDEFYNANTTVFSDGKPNQCAKWCKVGFKGLFYPKTNQLNIKVGMTDKSAKEVYINNFDAKQGKYVSSTKYTTPVLLPSNYTDYPNIKHVVSFKNLYKGEPSEPKPDKKTQIIIDFLHDKETNVKITSKYNDFKWRTVAVNPTNYNFTESKGDQVWLETDLNTDSTKYITADDTVYNIYYFKDGKPDDLDINNYSLDYLNKNATTKYITRTDSNLVDNVFEDNDTANTLDDKYCETFTTPGAFTEYGYYLILPIELKDYYGVLVDRKGNVLQKVYPNKENKIEEKYRPKYKDEVIGYYNEPYGETGGELINSYYYAHGKDYGITSQMYIDPNRYDNFICLPFDLITVGAPNLGKLPAFELRYTLLDNVKEDIGGYYNLDTGKLEPITIKENTGGSTGSSSTGSSSSGSSLTGSSSSGSSSSGSSSTGSSSSGSSSTGSSSSGSSSTGSSSSGSSSSSSSSSGTNIPNTPIDLNDQIHLYSINQQNIIDLSTKDLGYQTSKYHFANYNANNFINQVYILPFSLPSDLKELDDHIVTGLYRLDTDTVVIKQDHYDLDLGNITIKPKYNNGFDYNVTKCVLHLPFTNLINLDINDILNKTINIKYKVSLLNADTTINILSDDNLIFTGKINIGTDLQLFSINSNDIAGLLNSVLQNEVLKPYITITRNKPINNLVSYETHEHNQLNNYTGFVQTNNSSVSCGTQEEQQEIENLLNGGIYIK